MAPAESCVATLARYSVRAGEGETIGGAASGTRRTVAMPCPPLPLQPLPLPLPPKYLAASALPSDYIDMLDLWVRRLGDCRYEAWIKANDDLAQILR